MILEILLSEKDKNGRHHFRFLGKNETCRQQTAGEGGECADSRINNIYVRELAPRSCRVAAALWQMLRAVAFLLFWSLVALVLSVQSGFPIYFFYRISPLLAETLLVTHAADLRRGSLLKSIVLSDIYIQTKHMTSDKHKK